MSNSIVLEEGALGTTCKHCWGMALKDGFTTSCYTSKMVREQFTLIRRIVKLLAMAAYSFHYARHEFFVELLLEFLKVMGGRDGMRMLPVGTIDSGGTDNVRDSPHRWEANGGRSLDMSFHLNHGIRSKRVCQDSIALGLHGWRQDVRCFSTHLCWCCYSAECLTQGCVRRPRPL